MERNEWLHYVEAQIGKGLDATVLRTTITEHPMGFKVSMSLMYNGYDGDFETILPTAGQAVDAAVAISGGKA